MFNFVVQEHYASQHSKEAHANIRYWADPAQLNVWQASFRDGFREYFGATEGAVYVEELHLWNNNEKPDAFFAFRGTCGRSDAPKNCDFWSRGGPVDIHYYNSDCSRDFNLDRTIAHELGHTHAGLADEYDDRKGGYCAHTIMDEPWGTNFNLCRAADHNTAFQAPGSAPGGPGWSNPCFLDRTPFRPWETPDNYSFKLFDFNGLFGRVVLHGPGAVQNLSSGPQLLMSNGSKNGSEGTDSPSRSRLAEALQLSPTGPRPEKPLSRYPTLS